MYTNEALLDLHERSHRSLQKLMQHCRGLDADELDRELPGFGYESVKLQLQHLIGAQEYWLKVLRRQPFGDEDGAEYTTVDALEGFRAQVYAQVEEYLRNEDPNALGMFKTWGRTEEVELIPARVFIRTFTHIFQHFGQITAMCRLLGKPVPEGMDFPLL